MGLTGIRARHAAGGFEVEEGVEGVEFELGRRGRGRNRFGCWVKVEKQLGECGSALHFGGGAFLAGALRLRTCARERPVKVTVLPSRRINSENVCQKVERKCLERASAKGHIDVHIAKMNFCL